MKTAQPKHIIQIFDNSYDYYKAFKSYEDLDLLPPNSVWVIFKQWKQLKEHGAYMPLFVSFKKHSGYFNTRH